MKHKMMSIIALCLTLFMVNSCMCGGPSNNASMDRMESDEYNKSLEREMTLRKAGLNEAADIEKAQRQNYVRGGGYDSKDGGKQVHYNGSAQQQRDLDAIDEYMKSHPDF